MPDKFRRQRSLLLFVLVVHPTFEAHAKLRLGKPFGNHMVVQRNVALPVWGKADAGKTVVVQIGENKQTTVANYEGDWRVVFQAFHVTDRQLKIVVRSGASSITIDDVLVGEVWLCAGQSNMEWPVSSSASAKTALAAANNPQIRLLNYRGAARGGSGRYTVKHLANLTVEKFCKGQWKICSAESIGEFSAVGYYYGAALQRELDIPVGLINVAIGGTPTEAWVSREALQTHPQLNELVKGNWLDNKRLGPWCRERGKHNLSLAMKNGEAIPGDALGPNHSFKPGFMWKAAVAPLVPFPIRGVVWYQGESNAQHDWRVQQHKAIFKLLVTDWRQQFAQGDFPFLYAQLPGIRRPHWPEFREQQRRFLDSLANVGMAIAIDLGHPTNVHPKLKKPIGERLAHWALATTYQRKDTVRSGPLYRKMRIEGRRIVLEFDNVGTGLQTRDGLPLRFFEIAGADGKFHPATANIKNGEIVVSNRRVKRPSQVRYAWIPFPDPSVNFYNRENLPASPFATTIKKYKRNHIRR